ncbi:MAG: hypothetical protein LBN97_03185 [Oscillospiraceae bacterium]|jgi:hypothetical protein|nr:hypothetical protein [Oscillospiraceae bacterium]
MPYYSAKPNELRASGTELGAVARELDLIEKRLRSIHPDLPEFSRSIVKRAEYMSELAAVSRSAAHTISEVAELYSLAEKEVTALFDASAMVSGAASQSPVTIQTFSVLETSPAAYLVRDPLLPDWLWEAAVKFEQSR